MPEISAPDTGRTAEEMRFVEDGCRSVYGRTWDGPTDKMPGPAMKQAWRDLVVKAQQPVLEALAHLRAENANLRDRVREAEKGGRMSREAVADRMQQAFQDLTRLDAECAAEAAFPECLTLSPEPQEAGDASI